MAAAEQYLSEVLGAFDFGAPVVGAIRFGAGHINDTFVVHTQPDDCCRFQGARPAHGEHHRCHRLPGTGD